MTVLTSCWTSFLRMEPACLRCNSVDGDNFFCRCKILFSLLFASYFWVEEQSNGLLRHWRQISAYVCQKTGVNRKKLVFEGHEITKINRRNSKTYRKYSIRAIFEMKTIKENYFTVKHNTLASMFTNHLCKNCVYVCVWLIVIAVYSFYLNSEILLWREKAASLDNVGKQFKMASK